MDQIYLEREDSYLPMEYQGNVIYQSLLNGDWGFDINARFVVSDGDYKKIAAHTMTYPRVKQVLFDSDKPEKAVEFNNELYKIFAQRMSDSMKVGSNYDAYKAKTSEPDSMYAMEAIYDADNQMCIRDSLLQRSRGNMVPLPLCIPIVMGSSGLPTVSAGNFRESAIYWYRGIF